MTKLLQLLIVGSVDDLHNLVHRLDDNPELVLFEWQDKHKQELDEEWRETYEDE